MGGPRRVVAVVAVAAALMVGVEGSTRAAPPAITLPGGKPPAAYTNELTLPAPAGWR